MTTLIGKAVASIAAAVLTAPTRPAATGPARFHVKVCRTVGRATVDQVELSVDADGRPATVTTAGGSRLTVDRVLADGARACRLRVRYGLDQVDPATGDVTRRLVMTTIEPSLGRPVGLAGCGDDERLTVTVSAVAG